MHTPELPHQRLPAIHLAPRTPEMCRHVAEPVTPARDPVQLIDMALWVLENWRLLGGPTHPASMMTKIKST